MENEIPQSRTRILIKTKVKINQLRMEIVYSIVMIGLMSIVFLIGIVGIVKVLREIRNQNDTE